MEMGMLYFSWEWEAKAEHGSFFCLFALEWGIWGSGVLILTLDKFQNGIDRTSTHVKCTCMDNLCFHESGPFTFYKFFRGFRNRLRTEHD